jgi:DnaJ-class molecular chaperone
MGQLALRQIGRGPAAWRRDAKRQCPECAGRGAVIPSPSLPNSYPSQCQSCMGLGWVTQLSTDPVEAIAA